MEPVKTEQEKREDTLKMLAMGIPAFKAELAGAYAYWLRDVPVATLRKAVEYIVQTSRFAPSVAEIRGRVAEIEAREKQDRKPKNGKYRCALCHDYGFIVEDDNRHAHPCPACNGDF